jgi:hypothetical protein
MPFRHENEATDQSQAVTFCHHRADAQHSDPVIQVGEARWKSTRTDFSIMRRRARGREKGNWTKAGRMVLPHQPPRFDVPAHNGI